ncbi:fibroblast growth factor receptor 3-like, partial [Salvelinus namaycush]|uniref:Fibroblast growth factor receptor 3-like n=1 Tax=Salvelinus namaycush TaxID=8040 RepID=A0A8U0QB43_SALNM
MMPESETGLVAQHITVVTRGIVAMWCSLWLSLLLFPLSVSTARLPTVLPTDSVFLEDYVVSTGDTLDLSCNPDGPAQAVLWFKDGSGLLPSNRTRVDQRVLRIINVSYEDSGMYSCHVTHDNNLLSNYTIRVT